MKKIGLVFSLVLFFSVSFQVSAQWSIQTSGTTNSLYSIKFIDQNIGWVTGTNGMILKTTNGGNDWFPQNGGTNKHLYCVYFNDELNGWAVGTSGNLLEGVVIKTTDGGESWVQVDIFFNERANSVFFLNNNVGWIVGGQTPVVIMKTTNGGDTWIDQSYPNAWNAESVFFINENNGWVSTGWGEVLRTTNGGDSWTKIDVDLEWSLYSIFFVNPDTGFVVGDHSFKTIDGGMTWTQNGTSGFSIYFVDEQTGWKTNWNGNIYITTDCGLNWNSQSSGTTDDLFSIFLIDSTNGWICGNNGKILHTTNGGVTFIEEKNNFALPEQFLLQQNYPNPFNPSTTISWQAPVSGWQTLKVYDILGKEVATLVNEYRNAGSYKVDFSSVETLHAASLLSGVYFYQLRVGDYLETKKMVLLK